MKQSKINLILTVLFILIVGYSIYNDKIKDKNDEIKEETKEKEYELIENFKYYKLYKKESSDFYKYIIYSKDKEVIAEEETMQYTHVNTKDNLVEVKINYGAKSILSRIYDVDKKQIVIEKQNVFLFNDKYLVILNDENIEIQDIHNKDKYYKKIELEKEIINNIVNIKFTDSNKKLQIIYLDKKEEKKYSIKL